MEIGTRLKALGRLARSQTDEAKAALQKELDQVEKSLASLRDYEVLAQGLAVLDVIGHRFSGRSVIILGSFITAIEDRELQYSERENAFEQIIAKYRDAHALIMRAIEVLSGLRYLETSAVLRILLRLSSHASDEVRKKALHALDELAGYNINVFYGPDRKGGLGALPQKIVIDALEGMRDPDLVAHYHAALGLLQKLLSPTMESTSWSYKAVTFSRGSMPALPDVSEIRLRSIRLLKRLYGLASNRPEGISAVNALHNATRLHERNAVDQQIGDMIMRDTLEVLSFYEQLVQSADLQTIQRIEANSYWIYYHGHREAIKTAARSVERAIAHHEEYQIYRVLVGFEGVFGDWSELAKSQKDFGAIEEMRRRIALQYAASITSDNYTEWRKRILTYAETESDDLATFPIFYLFLEEFAKASPVLALRLVKEDSRTIERFLIPLLRGLWAGPLHGDTRSLIEAWIESTESEQGRYLFASAKMFLSNERLEVDLLKRLLAKAAHLDDLATVRQIVSVAITNYRDGQVSVLDELFLPALEALTRRGDARWIFDAWFRRELREVLAVLDEGRASLLLRNLISLPKIDYHAEEVLCAIAQHNPQSVLLFFRDRISAESERRQDRTTEFEAIPFEFHELQKPLSTIPRIAVRVIRELFDRDRSLFEFRGGLFLKNVFPVFSPEFEAELLELVKAGGDDNYSFVLGVLKNYEGELFIHGICREIVRSIAADSPFRIEVAIALEATGVVSGEFGMAEAYERKRKEALEWLTDPNERVQDFAKWYISNLERRRDAEQRRAEEDIALQKFRYGES